MIIIADFAFIVIVVLILGTSVAVGISMWILDHLALLAVLFILKSFFLFHNVIFRKEQKGTYYIGVAIFTIADICRNLLFLWLSAQILEAMFAGDIFNLFGELLLLVIEVPVYFICAETTMFPIYSDSVDSVWTCVFLQIIAVAALALVGWKFFIGIAIAIVPLLLTAFLLS